MCDLQHAFGVTLTEKIRLIVTKNTCETILLIEQKFQKII